MATKRPLTHPETEESRHKVQRTDNQGSAAISQGTGFCSRCQDLGLPKALPTIEQKLKEGDIIGLDDAYVNMVAQRLVFDIAYPQNFGCASCKAVFQHGGTDGLLAKSTDRNRLAFKLYSFEAVRATSHDNRSPIARQTTSKMEKMKGFDGEVFKPRIHKTLRATFGGIGDGVRPLRKTRIDYTRLRKLLDQCAEHHLACSSPPAPELKRISLIDVIERKLVKYPSTGECKYVALSYVWGRATSLSFQYGCLPKNTRRTIDDAIQAVRELGLRYLWVDMLCINQEDELHLSEQLNIMNKIYRGAFATIIASAGTSADDGLPGVSHRCARLPQRRVTFGNNELFSCGPTLDQQLEGSMWASRAWTFQESLFANRCLIWDEYQVHFLCNVVDTSESAEQTIARDAGERGLTTFFHNPSLPAPNCCGDLEQPPVEENYWLFSKALSGFVHRDLTHNGDRLRAIAGLLEQFRELYFPSGYLFGLPRENFRVSLAWVCRPPEDDEEVCTPLEDSRVTTRNPHFPSWSWAGWQLKGLVEMNRKFYQPLTPPPLLIRTATGENLYTNATDCASSQVVHWDDFPSHLTHADAVSILAFVAGFKLAHSFDKVNDLVGTTLSPPTAALKVDGILFDIAMSISSTPGGTGCNFKTPAGCRWQGYAHMDDTLEGNAFIVQDLDICAPPKVAPSSVDSSPRTKARFLLVAFHCHRWGLSMEMLLLKWEHGMAYRCGVVTANVEMRALASITECKPQLCRFLLG